MEATVKKQYIKPRVTRHAVTGRQLLSRMGVIILTFVLSTDNQAQVVVRNNTGRNDTIYNKVCGYVCRELGIEDIEVIISPIAFDKGIYWTEGGMASIHRFDQRTYGINLLQSPNEVTLVKLLIHELYHVKQIIDKRLWISEKANWFDGTLYTSRSDYYERPYEVEAEKFTREFYKANKKNLQLIIKTQR